MDNSKPQLKWNQVTEVRFGKKERTSKCGRYRIETLTFTLPFASIGYKVFAGEQSIKMFGCTTFDSLKEAKEVAEYHLNPDYEPKED